MRLVFMGTPHIAQKALEAVLAAGHEVAAVYTREDKPVGRKQVLTPPPVKILAEANGIPVLQPKTLRAAGEAEKLAAFAPDLCVVVAYGLLLPPEILAVPKHGCINLHVSLLPRWRGAAPIQWAVISGDEETGVSIMQLDEGLDTGGVISCEGFTIGPQQTAGEVFEKATQVGARLLVRTIGDIEAGTAKAEPQAGEVTHAPRLNKEMAEIDFARPAKEIHNLVRGCSPWPLAWFSHGGKRVKVVQAEARDVAGKAEEIVETNPLTIACGEGALELMRVVPEGGREMTGAEWAAGRRFKRGDVIQAEG